MFPLAVMFVNVCNELEYIPLEVGFEELNTIEPFNIFVLICCST